MGDLLFPDARRVSTRRSLVRSGGPNAARLSSNSSRYSSSHVPRRRGGSGTERTTLRWAHATHATHAQHTRARTTRRFSLSLGEVLSSSAATQVPAGSRSACTRRSSGPSAGSRARSGFLLLAPLCCWPRSPSGAGRLFRSWRRQHRNDGCVPRRSRRLVAGRSAGLRWATWQREGRE